MLVPAWQRYDIPAGGRAYGLLSETVRMTDGQTVRKTAIPHLRNGGPVVFTLTVFAEGAKPVTRSFRASWPEDASYAEISEVEEG